MPAPALQMCVQITVTLPDMCAIVLQPVRFTRKSCWDATGLRTPTRDTEEGQDEDLGRMQEDLDRVRQEMRDEATSARRHSQAVSEHRSQGELAV